MPFQLSIFHITAVVLLVISSALLNHGKTTPEPQVCASLDQPNPLAELFPNNATGVLNATLAIIPISLETARRLIPPQYGILERAYRALLPDFPEGMYPVMVQAAHDHDVQFRAYGITIDDFSVRPPWHGMHRMSGSCELCMLTATEARRLRVSLPGPPGRWVLFVSMGAFAINHCKPRHRRPGLPGLRHRRYARRVGPFLRRLSRIAERQYLLQG